MSSKESLKIMILSDGTGETASGMIRAAMAQFEDKEVYTTRYKNVRTKEQVEKILTEASLGHDIICYTIVQRELREFICSQTEKLHLRAVDLMGDLLTSLANAFGTTPKSIPGILHVVNDQYFKRVAAMEFTLGHDDGQNLDSLHLADVILVGISRTSKTPLSIYLSLNGLKVVNIPLIYGVMPTNDLYEVDQKKIFALTIDGDALWEIRKNRLKGLGVSGAQGQYADKEMVLKELEWANDIFRKNKRWPVLNVTGKAVEETASEVIRLLNMRKTNQFKQNSRFKE